MDARSVDAVVPDQERSSGDGGVGALVPESWRDDPVFLVAGAIGMVAYRNRGRLAALWRRIRGRGR